MVPRRDVGTATTLITSGYNTLGNTSTYTPVAADWDQFLVAEATAIYPSNYDPTTVKSSPSNSWSIYVANSQGAPTGTTAVGSTLTMSTASLSPKTKGGAGISGVTWTAQWYRGTTLVSGSATALTYVPTAADVGGTLHVRLTVSKPGYVPYTLPDSPATAAITQGTIVLTNPATVSLFGSALRASDVTQVTERANGVAVANGDFQGSLGTQPVVTVTPATNTLTANVLPGTITDPGVVYTYQWLRGSFPIAGATAKTHVLVAADYGYAITVRVTATKPKFTPYVLSDSVPHDYSIYSSTSEYVTGYGQVGYAESQAPQTYQADVTTITPAITYQWLRDAGTVIAGATGSTYFPQVADIGHTLKLRITTKAPGAIGTTVLSLSSGTITVGQFTGNFNAPVIAENPQTMTLTASQAAGAISETGTTLTYQWFRQTGSATPVPITNATASTYKLVEANDRDKTITVVITVKKPGYVDKVLVSNGYWFTFTSALTVTVNASHNPPQVGDILQLTSAGYDNSPSTVTYQWFRKTGSAAPVAIVGNLGTGSSYLVTAADVGSVIIGQVTGTYPGFFPNIQSAQTAAVVP